jgi:hypothetical protein
MTQNLCIIKNDNYLFYSGKKEEEIGTYRTFKTLSNF